MYTRAMPPWTATVPASDPVVELYKRDVDRTLFERNLRLTPSERLEQLQRFVALIFELQQARRAARSRDDRQAD